MRSNEDPSEYKFRFIEVKELDIIKREQPDLYNDASSRLLLSCPDVFEEFPCYFYILDSEDKTVCSVKTFPDRLVAGIQSYPWAWFGALFTEEDHRGRGLATRLIRESVAILHKRGIAWGGVFSTENALRIYRKLGFTIPGYADRYLFLKSGEAFFNVHIRSKSLSCFLNVLYMGAIKVIYKVFFSGRWFRGKSHCKLMLEECDEYNGIAFQEKIKNSTRFRFNDSIVKLNWKIGGCGQKGENICKPYIIKVSATNEIVGYCVVRNKLQIEPIASKYKNFMMMTLMDYGLFVDDERLYLSIIDKLFDLFWESSAEVFEVVSNSETLCAALRRKGMLRVGKGMSFKFSLPESWSISDGYEQLENWHLTHFCGDSFTF